MDGQISRPFPTTVSGCPLIAGRGRSRLLFRPTQSRPFGSWRSGLQSLVALAAGDTVELQGNFRVADGYFAADHTSFWGCKVG